MVEIDQTEGRALAVAVQDAGSVSERPRVVAKGHGKLAEQILNIAFERGVKVRSDADLAEILAAVDVDSEIPLEALAAVPKHAIPRPLDRTIAGGAGDPIQAPHRHGRPLIRAAALR